MAQTIKIIIALAVLALLPACWGLKRPSPVTVTIAEICGGNPFNAACDETYEIERIVKINECIAGGAATTPTCADAVNANSCIRDPFVVACEANPRFSVYIVRARSARATYCELPTANATLCASVAGSVHLDTECLDSPLDAPAYASCASRPRVVRACTDDPFTRTGCGNIPTIETLRIAHCEDSATAWDDGCVEETYAGATAARDTACLTHGIDANAGGHADCAMRGNVLAACSETSPFAHDVCDEVGDIDIKRRTFCLETSDNGGANPFNEGCETDGTHGDVSMARDTACLAEVTADDGCVALITQTCTDTPLAGVSCVGLDGHFGFLDTFCAKDNNAMLGGCAMTPAALCSADPFSVVTVRDGTVDCSADMAYDSDRQALCASGGQGNNECDTAVIAPVVCATSGANANPFADFCTGATMIGGSDAIAVIRQAVVTLCLNGANASMAVCMNTDTVVSALTTGGTRCVLIGNAFEDRCAYTQYEPARVGFCTTNLETAWNAGCTGGSHGDPTAMRLAACLAFGATSPGHNDCRINLNVRMECTADDDPFKHKGCDDVSVIEGRRATYCNREINAWKENCTKATYGVTHDPTTAQGKACVMFGTGMNGDSTCTTNTYAKNFCGMPSNNPLDTTDNMGCRVLENFAAIVGVYCVANSEIPACKVDSAAWTGSFTTSLATAISASHTTNQFLSGLTGATDVPTTDFTEFLTTDTPVKANASPHLNLADNAHGFGGQADDGVMFFGGTFTSNSQVRYYAGVYTTTNLGAPLTSVSQNGEWQAWIRTSGKDPDNESFMLTVDFNATTAMGTLKAFFQSTLQLNAGDGLYYDINGRFGINGVITGNVAIGTEDSGNGRILASGDEYTLGDLTGLIGADGVVAAFVSNTKTASTTDELNPFVGGFVAAPLVTYADWNLAATPDAALEDSPIANQFLADVVTNGGAGVTSVTLDSAQYNSASLGGEATDGFAHNTDSTDAVVYVGILPTTNLGLPLNNATQAGAWNGSFVSIEGATVETTDFTLTVTFGGASAGKAGSISATIATTDYSFVGEFNSSGVIDGTVTHTDTTNSTGPLQGLIGSGGAVGVFISNAGTQDFGGGFVARKP